MHTIDHSQRAHSRIGASSSKRWFNCPASVPLSKDVVKTTSKYAEEGTAAHELAEYCLENDLDAVHGLGLYFNEIAVTQEMTEAVQVYLDVVRERINDECDVLIEDQFHLGWIDEDLYGSNDCCIVDHSKGKITVIDYKHGAGVAVEAVENTQLLYYALGASNGFSNITQVDLIIVQPRCASPEGPVRIWNTDIERLEKFEKELKDAVNVVKDAEASKDVYSYAYAGDHCQFCPAAGFCEKLRSKNYEMAQSAFSEEVIDPPLPDTLSPEQISKVLRHAKLIENWIKSVREYAHTQAEAGLEIPNMKLVARKGNRKWTNEAQTVDDLSMLLDEKSLYTKKLISPAQAEKLLGKGSVDELVTVPDNGTQLVAETDKRPAVKAAIELFDL